MQYETSQRFAEVPVRCDCACRGIDVCDGFADIGDAGDPQVSHATVERHAKEEVTSTSSWKKELIKALD